MNKQQQYDYIISKGFSHDVAQERLGITEAITPLHPVYGNRTADEYFQHFYGMTPDQVRAFIKDQKELKKRIAKHDDVLRQRNRTLTDEQIEDARTMRAEGISWKIIGAKFGMTPDAIRVRLST